MTDLGHLLGGVEEHVERAHADARPSDAALAVARRTVRRRRVLRDVRRGGVGALVVVAAAGLTTWGPQGGVVPPAAVDPVPSVTPSAAVPSAAPTASPGTLLPLGAPVQVASPRDVPVADLLAAAGPGWTLATVVEERAGQGGAAPWDPANRRTVIALVAPTGERTPLLDVDGAFAAGVDDWRVGEPTAFAAASPWEGEGSFEGLLDLTTGVLTPVPFDWERHPLGLTATGESAWLFSEMPAELLALDAEQRSHYSPIAPGYGVALDPEQAVAATGEDPAAVLHTAGTLRLVAADGTTRDLGDVALPHRLHPLSPDRAWLALHAPDGGLLGLDVRTGATHPVAGAPADPACRLAGWAGAHAVLTACPDGAGAWRLAAVDVAQDRPATPLATSDVPVRDAWPLGDGRVGLGRVVMPAPCDVTSDPAVLEDGTVRSLTEGWSPYDHGTDLTFAGGGVWTFLNGCYAGGRADPQRTVRVDLATGDVTTVSWFEDRGDVDQVVEDGDWRVTSVDVVPAR
ncbi:hypothetical protein [Cellulomonas wangsupingiae]|uniref:WD40 repeat domain-containing protein n=1 Tax=Cellulomonas wangsupingiae TaxID=2968085 RepID=A0ABY5K486_9CELL|nr:hypothetical protein [Cellulomonas wangsupingiae]MCC2333892.1 hypothetical protein [Cellulomonas wangsupingiae]UUI65150.1 hypothetical protein NP075_18910 [Cellulomonas wangsupingiae]